MDLQAATSWQVSMYPRFDLFRKQNDHFIKWIATAESLEDLDKLIRDASQDEYIIVRSADEVTGAFTNDLQSI